MSEHQSKRKSAAVALAVLGVAGLTLATAAELNVRASNEVAIGADTFAQCDTDGVAVDYSYSKHGDIYAIDALTVTGIADTCTGEPIAVSLKGAQAVELLSTSGTVAGGTFTFDASELGINIETDLGEATVIIG
ncbi:hypothetical protein [Demequina sp.]|uniref:hypothetical protein n=1 Tax=Demequina sp. TaxID=2050685 RepID=UPI003A887754